MNRRRTDAGASDSGIRLMRLLGVHSTKQIWRLVVAFVMLGWFAASLWTAVDARLDAMEGRVRDLESLSNRIVVLEVKVQRLEAECAR